MDPERWKRIDEIFHAVLDREPSSRKQYLAEACDGDDSLRLELERLIACHEEKSNVFDHPLSDVAAALLAKQDVYMETISHYRILKKIGRGGMGEVYLAEDTRLNRKVALKLLPPEFTKDKQRIRRFEQEARAVSALNHPNILTIYDVGQTESSSFIATEYIDGESLRQRMHVSKVPLKELLTIVIQVGEALDAAHQAGIMHRDIKPENIMLRKDGYVKVLDFGLAKLTEPATGAPDLETVTQTQIGVVIGTFRYMSPEQARGLRLDARTDIFSLGVVLYELVTQRVPFDGATSSDVIAAILEKNPPALGTFGEFPEELQSIITKALTKDLAERYQTIKDLIADLKGLRKRMELGEELKRSKPVRTLRKSRMAAIVGLILVVLIAGGIYKLKMREKPIGSLAILPFINVSGDSNTEYLSDGITETLINSLSQLPKLRVMARGTVFSYKSKEVDPRMVGRDLKVEAVVTGRVKPQGNLVLISADLVRVKDGTQLWGKQYSWKVSELPLVQERIAGEIAENLRIKLTGQEKQRLTKRYTENAKAYQLYLRGLYHWFKNNKDDYEKARQYFQQAIEIDPLYGLAYSGLGDYYNALASEGYGPPEELRPKAKAALMKALSLDEKLSQPHYGLAQLKFLYEWNWPEAEQEFKLTIELDPSDPRSYRGYSWLLVAMGRIDEAIEQSKIAQQLDPLSRIYTIQVAQHFTVAERYDEAIQEFQKTLDLDPNYDVALFGLADVFALKGNYKEASSLNERVYTALGDDYAAELFRNANGKTEYDQAYRTLAKERLEMMLEVSKEQYVPPVEIASIYSQLGEKDEAFQWLEKAYQERSAQLVFLRVNKDWENLRSDPRFADLTKRIGLM